MLLKDSTKDDTAVFIVFFAELFEVKRDRGSLNKVFVVPWWESTVDQSEFIRQRLKVQIKEERLLPPSRQWE